LKRKEMPAHVLITKRLSSKVFGVQAKAGEALGLPWMIYHYHYRPGRRKYGRGLRVPQSTRNIGKGSPSKLPSLGEYSSKFPGMGPRRPEIEECMFGGDAYVRPRSQQPEKTSPTTIWNPVYQ
jgi:hypothetical protein